MSDDISCAKAAVFHAGYKNTEFEPEVLVNHHAWANYESYKYKIMVYQFRGIKFVLLQKTILTYLITVIS